jgi:hypothetical protein
VRPIVLLNSQTKRKISKPFQESNSISSVMQLVTSHLSHLAVYKLKQWRGIEIIV